MSISELMVEASTAIGSGGCILFILFTIIQIAPIKVNPWSFIAKVFGRAVNGEVIEKVAGLEEKIDSVNKKVNEVDARSKEQAAISARIRILRFGDELLKNTKHTKDYFDQTLRDIKAYDLYCRDHPDFENQVTELTSQHINDVYLERLEKNDFLC